MLETIKEINGVLNGFIWGIPAMVCILGVGLYLSIRTGFIQIRKFGYSMRNTIGRIFKKTSAAEGSMTPFQAVCTALAATVGTGNIACSRCHRRRRPGSRVLDVDLRTAGHVHQICGSHTGCPFPGTES